MPNPPPPSACPRGVIAAGHPHTVSAAEEILRDGGNAFDAVVAAHLAACVVEPVLASLGGGGFLLAHTATGGNVLYDFFVQTPRRRRPPDERDFYPILADFGAAAQEFHIGLGAVATPGTVRGLAAIHRDLCSLPFTRLAEPAVALARQGVRINRFQAYIFDIIGAIYHADGDTRAIYASRREPRRLVGHRELLRQPLLADAIEAIAGEGERLFYEGEIGQALVRQSRQGGGHLTIDDLRCYRVVRRTPLTLDYRGWRLHTNPAPSIGGLLIAFGLSLLNDLPTKGARHGSASHLRRLASVIDVTQHARRTSGLDLAGADAAAAHLFDPDHLADYRRAVAAHPLVTRGTTQISVMDQAGNTASMTVSNGEGCGRLIPDTGIMLNNMLGEQDLNVRGFHCWAADTRMASMMAPSVLIGADGRMVAAGSGGSNRIRTAMLQFVSNIVDYALPLRESVHAPRMHLEGDEASIEPGFDADAVSLLESTWSRQCAWPARNLYFGGVHAVERGAGGCRFAGCGDPRRGGVHRIVR